MHKIFILAVGKLKEGHWQAAQQEFLLRLAPFARTEVIEAKAEPITDSRGAAISMRLEGESILAKLPQDSFVIVLDRTGQRLASEKLAQLLNEEGGRGRALTFVIGGAAGLDQAVLAKADRKISLSDLTFTHEMARIFLLEQLYRAETILTGKKYHY